MGAFSRQLRQPVTYWAPDGTMNRYGKEGLAAPVVVNGAWENVTTQAVDETGQERVSTATVHVASAVKTRGWLAYGTYTETDPTAVAARVILQTSFTAAIHRPSERVYEARLQ